MENPTVILLVTLLNNIVNRPVVDLVVSRGHCRRFLRLCFINLWVLAGQTDIGYRRTDRNRSFSTLDNRPFGTSDVPMCLYAEAEAQMQCKLLKHACVFYMFIIVARFSTNTVEQSFVVVDV